MNVLFMNDSPEAVVVGSDEFLQQELERHKAAYAKLNPHVSHNVLYWHYHTVPLIQELLNETRP